MNTRALSMNWEEACLHGFEDCDDGIAFVKEPFLGKVGLEKLHTGRCVHFLSQCCSVALLFGIWHRELLMHCVAHMEFLEELRKLSHWNVAVWSLRVGPVLFLIFRRSHLVHQIYNPSVLHLLEVNTDGNIH